MPIHRQGPNSPSNKAVVAPASQPQWHTVRTQLQHVAAALAELPATFGLAPHEPEALTAVHVYARSAAVQALDAIASLPVEARATALLQFVQAAQLHRSKQALPVLGEAAVVASIALLDALSQTVFAHRSSHTASPTLLRTLTEAWQQLLRGPMKSAVAADGSKLLLTAVQGMWPLRLESMAAAAQGSLQGFTSAATQPPTQQANKENRESRRRGPPENQAFSSAGSTSRGSFVSLVRSLCDDRSRLHRASQAKHFGSIRSRLGNSRQPALHLRAPSNPFASSGSVAQPGPWPLPLRPTVLSLGDARPLGKLREYDRQDLQDFAIKYAHRRLQGTHHLWLRSQRIWSGTYGKVSIGRIFGQPSSQKVAIKEMRLFEKKPAQAGGPRKTKPLDKNFIEDEIAETARIRRAIEDHVKEIEVDLWPGENPLDAVRTGQQRSIVYDHFEDAATGKVYMISTLELGSVNVLCSPSEQYPQGYDLPALQRSDLVASIGAQTFVELAAMHTHARAAHLDLKPENIHINGFGQAKLADFGLAAALDQAGNTPGISVNRGTIVAPEMLRSAAAAGDSEPTLSTATDVFALSMSLIDLLVGTMRPPFRRPQHLEGRANAAERDAYLTSQAQALGRLLSQLRTPDGFALPLEASAPFPNTGDAVVDAYFGRAFVRDPELTLLLLAGLELDPSRRPPATALAKALAGLLPPENSERQRFLLHVFYRAERSGVYHEVFADALRFEELVAARPPAKAAL